MHNTGYRSRRLRPFRAVTGIPASARHVRVCSQDALRSAELIGKVKQRGSPPPFQQKKHMHDRVVEAARQPILRTGASARIRRARCAGLRSSFAGVGPGTKTSSTWSSYSRHRFIHGRRRRVPDLELGQEEIAGFAQRSKSLGRISTRRRPTARSCNSMTRRWSASVSTCTSREPSARQM